MDYYGNVVSFRGLLTSGSQIFQTHDTRTSSQSLTRAREPLTQSASSKDDTGSFGSNLCDSLSAYFITISPRSLVRKQRLLRWSSASTPAVAARHNHSRFTANNAVQPNTAPKTGTIAPTMPALHVEPFCYQGLVG